MFISLLVQCVVIYYWSQLIPKEEKAKKHLTSRYRQIHDYRIFLIRIVLMSAYLIALFVSLSYFVPPLRLSATSIMFIQLVASFLYLKSKLGF